ncbi:AAA family ATPase [soil metagenome]
MAEQPQSTLSLSELTGLIKEQLGSRAVMIAIDGCGGSGKTYFAKRLAEQLHGISSVITVHMDDFFKPSILRLPQRECDALIGSDFDWQRLRREVLLPLSRGENASYQRYDWDRDCLAQWHTVPAYGLTIVEGIYTTRQELAAFFDITCWVYCCREQRLERGIERDGEAKREIWEKYWMPAEDRYVELEEPHKRAKILVDGSGCSANLSLRCELSSLFVPS